MSRSRRSSPQPPDQEAPDRGWRLYDEGAIAALVDGRHGDPFAVLGPHATTRGVAIRVFRPGAETAEAVDSATGETLAELLRRHRSEEHTSELQSLMRISYAVFCLKKKKDQL